MKYLLKKKKKSCLCEDVDDPWILNAFFHNSILNNKLVFYFKNIIFFFNYYFDWYYIHLALRDVDRILIAIPD